MSISMIVGALGLFLLGMWLMTEGMKLAAGRALKHLLGTWTSSRIRGLAMGIMVTAIVQSSSAVTVATIGFVNARLMTFSRSTWVIFGSNVGTTFTAWLVTVFGLKIDMGATSFAMIGVGAFMRVFSPYERGRALGMAVAGFGVLFMGIDSLQAGFASVAESGHFLYLMETKGQHLLWGLFIGLLLTVMTQSSSAAIAIILTAVSGGLIGVDIAAAIVIGANVGTTSTALITTLGATANAKRLAWSHVLFNVVTGCVALLLLPLFLWVSGWFATSSYWIGDATVQLSVFHTLFNVLGVLLMWPLEPGMTRFLSHRFQRTARTEKTEFLDKNVASVPDLALHALSSQLHQLAGSLCTKRLEKLVKSSDADEYVQGLGQVVDELDGFLETVSQTALTERLAEQLTASLAIKHYLQNSLQAQEQMVELFRGEEFSSLRLREQVSAWLGEVSDFTAELFHMDNALATEHWTGALQRYQLQKKQWMSAGATHQEALNEIDIALQIASFSKRYVEQLLHTLPLFEGLDKEGRSGVEAANETSGALLPESTDAPEHASQ